MNQPIRMASLLATPAVGFEQPFEMLEACHERVNRMLALLVRLREYLPGHGADDNARQAARDVMRYFDLAAPHHHQDEELHVFPPLLAAGDAATVDLVRRLQRDHLQMESSWREARKVLDAVASGERQSLSAQRRGCPQPVCRSLRRSHPGRRTIGLPGGGGPARRAGAGCYGARNDAAARRGLTAAFSGCAAAPATARAS